MSQLDPKHSLTLSIEGITIYSSLPLYLFMYPNATNTLAIIAHLSPASTLRLTSDILFCNATESDVHALLSKVRLCPCSKCGAPAFDPSSGSTNRNGVCEPCFMTNLNAKFATAQKAENKAARAAELKQLKKGYTHKIDAWIHPSQGDDYQCTIFTKTHDLSTREIQRLIKQQGSVILTDYVFSKIEPPKKHSSENHLAHTTETGNVSTP